MSASRAIGKPEDALSDHRLIRVAGPRGPLAPGGRARPAAAEGLPPQGRYRVVAVGESVADTETPEEGTPA